MGSRTQGVITKCGLKRYIRISLGIEEETGHLGQETWQKNLGKNKKGEIL